MYKDSISCISNFYVIYFDREDVYFEVYEGSHVSFFVAFTRHDT